MANESNMNKIATLGPSGTYSELASQKYLKSQDEDFEIVFFNSIPKALSAVNNNQCQRGVIPIENFAAGFIPPVLDSMANTNFTIIAEVILPIQFSFVSHEKALSDIDKLYVQFVAKSQCSEFISSIDNENINIINTDSNIESLNYVLNHADSSSAIVPANSYNPKLFKLVKENVTDYENNQTRFLVITNHQISASKTPLPYSKTSLVVLDHSDRLGILNEILTTFSSRNINLLSIHSRPTREQFGRYNFFIEIDGHINDKPVSEAIKEVKHINSKTKVLGSYPIANII